MGFGTKKTAGEAGSAAGNAQANNASAVASKYMFGPSGTVENVVFDGLCKSYGENHVLRNVSLTLEAGSVTCLMAPSGSGKTTLFRTLLGLEALDAGRVSGVQPGEISMMFQEDRLSSTLTPVENVALVLSKQVRRADVRDVLAEILPADCLAQPAMELSGGMRRRVSLARALCFPSKMVVLDEPFTGLDVETKRRVIEFILRHAAGRTLLIATHGTDDAALLGARAVSLADLQGASTQQTQGA